MACREYNWPVVCPTQHERRDVYARLTDPHHFTGIHRFRFDDLGNGRGRAGAHTLVVNDGWTASPSRPQTVYSSAIKTPRPPVVEPGTLGVQKFGVQITTPKLIWIYRNGDGAHDGAPLLVKNCYKSLQQIYALATKAVSPLGGPCLRLYDQNLHAVTEPRELVDGAKYLATSGEPPAPGERLRRFLSPWILA